jgi:hypothetical protein
VGNSNLERVRRLCLALPITFEKLSHGEPTFFAGKRTFAMFSNNHHNDGHIAVWLAAEPGEQERLVAADPATYYRPPYVGPSGWVGINLDQIDDEELGAHIVEAHRLIMGKQAPKQRLKNTW